MTSTNVKLFAGVTLAAAAALGVFAYLNQPAPPPVPTERGMMAPSAIGAPFVLTDAEGQRFESGRLKGKVTLLFFGFTHCPDVCPTTLAVMSNVLDELGPLAKEVQPVFISVDPGRDTPEVLKTFGSIFDPRIVMLTGSADEVAAVVAAYHVHAKRVHLSGGDYVMDHTASVFLLDRDGRFRSTFDFGEDEAVIMDKVRLVLGDPAGA